MAGVVTTGLWRWRPISRVEVRGDSMRPTLEPGDRLLVVWTRTVAPGDVVAFADPRQPDRTMVKRVAACGPDGLTLLGDNRAFSTDSRTWGSLAPSSVRGRVFYRYFPDSRRGLLYPHR